jgi:hypothetical protein
MYNRHNILRILIYKVPPQQGHQTYDPAYAKDGMERKGHVMMERLERQQDMIQVASDTIRQALRTAGCTTPVQIIEQGNALYIGTPQDHMEVRYTNDAWHVTMTYAPYPPSVSIYRSLAECAYDIAHCRPGMPLDEDEQRVVDDFMARRAKVGSGSE